MAMKYSHKEMVNFAAQRLHRWHCAPVFRELVTNNQTGEIPDAIGWTPRHSILIECKTTRGDFLRDRHKPFRSIFPEHGMGNWRFYFAQEGVILPSDDLLPGWGVYILTKQGRFEHLAGVRYNGTHPSPFMQVNTRAEIQMLRSHIRREAEKHRSI